MKGHISDNVLLGISDSCVLGDLIPESLIADMLSAGVKDPQLSSGGSGDPQKQTNSYIKTKNIPSQLNRMEMSIYQSFKC